MEKTVDKPSAKPGDQVLYRIVIINDSDVDVTNVRFIDTIIRIREIVTLLPARARIEFVFPFIIPTNAGAGSEIVNTLLIFSDQTPPQRVTATVKVLPVPGLAVKKNVSPSVATPGETVTFFIEVANTGNVPLSPVTIDDPILGRFNIVQLRSGGLATGVSGSLSIPFKIPEAANEGIIRNETIVTSDQTGPISAFADLTVLPDEEE
ncbi:DUF11 domain-containing protein [Paenibacillus sacheonensis]|uniref:DUF11 domain-containing protein n=1 Tax=Paenibacillus sacheonensis TaxID=742054 RepID=A0A7X5C1Q4_9BACL|nr:DUF11 domain-containing protein [Paenibacillus sacheonensis]MBM7569159.1 putative repeat protein (TIGR01451 family) [Paenibacillus sacheonensis]NBC72992.1 DUF11 domain-containing protein [Paenibacillus sacheonensis]